MSERRSDTIVLPVPERLFATSLWSTPAAATWSRGVRRNGFGAVGPLVDLHPMVDVVAAEMHPMSTLVHVLTCADCGGAVSSEVADRLTKADSFVESSAPVARPGLPCTCGRPPSPRTTRSLRKACRLTRPDVAACGRLAGLRLRRSMGLPDRGLDKDPHPRRRRRREVGDTWDGTARPARLADRWPAGAHLCLLGAHPGRSGCTAHRRSSGRIWSGARPGLPEIESIAQVAMTDIESSFQANIATVGVRPRSASLSTSVRDLTGRPTSRCCHQMMICR